MNKEELLSEGYLAAYITGETNDSQSEEIASFIASDEEVRREYFELQKTLELLSFRYSLPPATEVKKLVMKDSSVTKSVTFRTEGYAGGVKLLVAASLFVTFFSLLAAFYFWNEWRSTDEKLALLTERNLELTHNYYQVNQDLADIREDLAVLVSPEFSRVILEGTENSPDAQAVIYWNRKKEQVYLNSGSLATLPADRQYQLWALIDGEPVDAGVFDASSGNFQIMKAIAKADAFAVTIEQAGGNESPTLSTLQLFGENS